MSQQNILEQIRKNNIDVNSNILINNRNVLDNIQANNKIILENITNNNLKMQAQIDKLIQNQPKYDNSDTKIIEFMIKFPELYSIPEYTQLNKLIEKLYNQFDKLKSESNNYDLHKFELCFAGNHESILNDIKEGNHSGKCVQTTAPGSGKFINTDNYLSCDINEFTQFFKDNEEDITNINILIGDPKRYFNRSDNGGTLGFIGIHTFTFIESKDARAIEECGFGTRIGYKNVQIYAHVENRTVTDILWCAMGLLGGAVGTLFAIAILGGPATQAAFMYGAAGSTITAVSLCGGAVWLNEIGLLSNS